MATISQRMAQAAFPAVQARKNDPKVNFKEYTSFAKKFPSLIHACGLAQALAFAEAKKETDYLDDLTRVVGRGSHPEIKDREDFSQLSREQPLSGYLRLSRHALIAAGWLKRYVEAAGEEE